MANYFLNDDGSLSTKKKKKSGNNYVLGDNGKITLIPTQDDIAPVKKQAEKNTPTKKKWYEQILQTPKVFKDNLDRFDDGYQFGDITKTVGETIGDSVTTLGGSLLDVGTGIGKGALNIGENIGTLATAGVAQVADWTGHDEWANKKRKKIANFADDPNRLSNRLSKWQEENIDDYSIFGATTDKTAEAVGYIGGIWATGGAASGAAGAAGASAGTAATVGNVAQTAAMFGSAAGGEASEVYQKENVEDWQAWTKILGAGAIETATERLFGIFGKSGLDKGLANAISSKITSGAGKIFARVGVQASSEAAEEFISYMGNQTLDTAIDFVNEQTGGDGAEFKEDWNWEEVGEQMAIAFLASGTLGTGANVTSTIQNKTNQNTWSQALSETARQQDEQAQIEGLQQSIEEKQEQFDKSQDAREKQIIQESINGLTQELNELTNAQSITDESELRKQNFIYQAQETDSDIKKAVYESASQVMNNTQKSHKFVDVVAKIAEEKGTTYKFTNNEQLKQLGYVKDNVTVNGLVNENGEVLINIDSAKALNTVVGHETTHLLEGTNEYEALKQVAIEYAKSKGDYDTRIENLTKLYEGTNADIEAELTSDIVGEYLFTDENFVKELSVKQPTVFEKIKNFISDLIVKFKGTDQEKQLMQLQRSFEKAYKAQSTQTSTEAKYSLNDNQGRTLTKEQQEYFKDSKVRDEEGNLLTVYHGTNADFNVFKKGKKGYLGPGIYLAEERSQAERYTDYGMVKEVYVDIKNPLTVTSNTPDKEILNAIYGSDNVYNRRATKDGLGNFLVNSKDLKKLQEIGYDGIAWKYPSGNEYMVLNSNQIKNVDNTNPTSNPDIRYSLSEDNKGNTLSKEQQERYKYSKIRDNNGNLKVMYHGTARADRVGTLFDPNRATSGPMAFFTDNQEIAQNYSTNKSDTSLTREYDTEYDLFKVDGKDLDTYWNSLSYAEKQKINKEGNNVGFDDDWENVVYGENASEDSFSDMYKWYLNNETNGNGIKALYQVWIQDGNIMDDDLYKFQEVLEKAGVKNVEFLDPYKVDSKVYEVYLNVTNPFDTSNMSEDIINQFKEASKTATIGEQYSADMWDKSNIAPEAWIEKLENDIENGTAHAWTVIPDWVTNVLKANGYDGIVDTGGKNGGETHQVVIPFYSEQIKDITNTNPTDNPNIDMSLSAQNEDIAPTGNWNVRGEDIKYQVEEAIAPLQEKIESLTEQLDTVVNSIEQKQENIVPEAIPIQEVQPTRPTLEEVQNLMDIKENQSGSDYARAFFALRDKYGQPNLYKSLNEYNKTGTIKEDTTEDYAAPISQEVVEKQGQEAFNNITDNEAPIDVSNMSFEDAVDSIMDSGDFEYSNTEHIPSPLDSRDIDEVGNRKVKAYQYENPEVKPYFQAEAQAMLGDLDSTIKGVRTPVLDQDGYITGWYGLERQTTEAISYLKDKYGYSYEQIRKGLNAIIEDDGKENNAVSKRIEFMLDERLREGYTTSDGFPIPPNEEYINFLNENQITEYNKEAFNALTDADAPLEILPEPQESATINQNIKDEEYVPLKRITAQKANTKLTNTNKLQQSTKRVTEPTIPEPVNDAKQLTLDGTEEDLVAKTKKQLRRELIEPNKEFFANALDNAKNRSMAFMNNTDTIRNTELVFGREAGKVINDVIFQKEIDNEADSIAWQNKERQEIKDLGIKARSKESAAVQKYGEKQYVNEEGKVVPYGDAELAKEFPDIDTQNKIKQAAQVIRNKYDNYIDEANEVLTKLGFDPIKKRKDYMRHFQELTDVFSRNGIPFNAKNMQEHVLPTDINGLTEFWSPQKNYFASMQARKGIKTTYDAITGIDGYIGGISNLIFHTEDIQRGRAFEELIRETYGESKGWENLEKLPDELKQARAEKIQDNHLSNYAAWVHEWTNNVAGKKNKLDRSIEATFGRKAFSFLDEIRKQVGSNMIGLNVSSSLTNLIAPVQAMSKTNKLAMAKGTADTIKNIFVKDNFVENNKFLTSRFGTDMLSKNAWQKIQDAGYVFMKGVDWFSANQIVRSKFYELRAKGLSEADAHTQAGQFAARIMGNRTKGATPQLYNSKLVGLVTQFQLEVNNQLYSQFYDTYQESKENAKGNALKTAAGMTFTLGQIFAFTHLFGQTFEAIAGYNPTFDIVEMIKTAFGWGDDDEEEKTTSERLKEAADQLVDALPYVNIFTGGGRIPIASGIPNLIGVATGGTDDYGNELTLEDELKKLLLLLPPTGGNQAKKAYEGLSMYNEELPIAGSYTDSGNLRYTVEDNIPSKLQAGLFGKWANPNAQAYIDSDFKTIDKNNIEELVELGFDSNEYRKYKTGLNEIKSMELEDGEARATYLFDYINSQDVTEEQKSIMIKHLLSEEESEDLSSLNMTTDETIDYYKAKANITQQVAEYVNDKSLLTGDTESEEYKEAVNGLSDEKKSNIIDTIKNTSLSDEQKAYLYGKYYSSDKTLDKVINSGISFDDYLTYSKDSLSLESTEDKAKYLYESNLTDDAKTVIYETSVLTGFDNEDKYKDYKAAKAAEVDINSWLSYKKQEFVADKDEDGDSIRGSRKDKIISYVNSLELNIPQKAIMIRTEYSTFDDYNNQIVSYINGLDLNYEEKVKVLENLDFTIGEDGSVYWD